MTAERKRQVVLGLPRGEAPEIVALERTAKATLAEVSLGRQGARAEVASQSRYPAKDGAGLVKGGCHLMNGGACFL